MADGGGDGRRKHPSASAQTKSPVKESSRSKSHATSSSASSNTVSSTPRKLSKSNSRTKLNSSTSKGSTLESPTSNDDETARKPIFGSVHGGSRSNNIRAGRERTAWTAGDEDNRKNPRSPDPTSKSDPSGALGRARGRLESASAAAAQKRGGNSRSTDTPSPGPTSGNSTENEEPEREGKRGSYMGKITRKAKQVLPLRNLGPRSITSSTSAPLSSVPSSPPNNAPPTGSESSSDEEEEEEEEEEEDGNEPLSGTSLSMSPKDDKGRRIPPPISTGDEHRARGSLGVSPGRERESPRIISSPGDIVRPKTVPPRVTSADAIHQLSAQPPLHKPGLTKRSNKIMEMSAADMKLPEPVQEAPHRTPPLRSPSTSNSLGPSRSKKPSMNSIREVSGSVQDDAVHPGQAAAQPPPNMPPPLQTPTAAASRPYAFRSTSAIKISSMAAGPRSLPPKSATDSPPRRERRPTTYEPPMPEPDREPKVEAAPPSGMHWSRVPCFGWDHGALRAHTTTLVGSNIYVFGGCDSHTCFNELYVLDADCMSWTRPECMGTTPPALRAMTATALGKKIVLFGGGDGPSYYNDVFVLDTLNFRYNKPTITGTQVPSKRRAHTACLYKSGIYVFGGGDGVKALNDVWRLDVADVGKGSVSWRQVSAPSKSSTRPTARGYHTANMVGSKLIIFGGSDGLECFKDVWVFDVESLLWRVVEIKTSFPRLSHSANVVGSYLFVVGGHDGVEYSNDVLLLNLVTMQWDRRKVYGSPPSGRGYHGAVLYDSRLFIIGGFDGHTVYEDTYLLELAVSAYYSQISHFTIDV
ncbi:MAG: hypothetical protein M1825_001833 [Sarcosagium campestre]|nr:MAG: hypothetical protein M1825_001833 [Sarcosagium campestre]